MNLHVLKCAFIIRLWRNLSVGTLANALSAPMQMVYSKMGNRYIGMSAIVLRPASGYKERLIGAIRATAAGVL